MLWFLPVLLWLLVLVLPWQAWRNREVFRAAMQTDKNLADICVLIPARNEGKHIINTLQALARQGQGLQVIVIDDQSTDDTAAQVSAFTDIPVQLLAGQALPAGWSGKLWALQQGLQYVQRPYTLLLDADIELQDNVLASSKRKMQDEGLDFISYMASLRMQAFWEKLLLPAFIYYFKLIYPFACANKPKLKAIAAAAGGFILLKTAALRQVNAFDSIRETLIDDCSLAKKIKQQGYRTWIGLTRDVRSTRGYTSLADIWQMVARTAFTQLQHSVLLLLMVTAIFALMYFLPLVGLFVATGQIQIVSLLALAFMMLSYIPTLHYYQRGYLWVLALPLIASLFMLMTWSSAWQYWFRQGNEWRGRRYAKNTRMSS